MTEPTSTGNPGATGLNVDATTLLGGGTLGRQILVTTIAIVLGPPRRARS